MKLEDGLPISSVKKQRTSPQPRTVVDLSNDTAFSAQLPLNESSTASSVMSSYVGSKPLHNSFSTSSLSTFVCPPADSQGHFPYLMDEQPPPHYQTQHATRCR